MSCAARARPTRVVIERMSEEIQKDVAMMGTLRQAGIRPGAEVSAEVGRARRTPDRGGFAQLRDRRRSLDPPLRLPRLTAPRDGDRRRGRVRRPSAALLHGHWYDAVAGAAGRGRPRRRAVGVKALT